LVIVAGHITVEPEQRESYLAGLTGGPRDRPAIGVPGGPYAVCLRRESQPTAAPSTAPTSGASGRSVVRLTTMPRATPSAAPTAMAAPTLTARVYAQCDGAPSFLLLAEQSVMGRSGRLGEKGCK
jgi:hypothetical protein